MSIVRNKIFSTNTAKYTLVDLKEEMMECINILLNLGYEVHIPTRIEINSRLLNTFGQCVKRRGVYWIQVNLRFLKTASPQSVHDMIMHECIHCVEGCFNHGKIFKEVGKKVMEQYPQYNITRCLHDEQYERSCIESSVYRYRIVCEGCGGSLASYKRWSKILESISHKENRYKCKRCSSTNLKIVNL